MEGFLAEGAFDGVDVAVLDPDFGEDLFDDIDGGEPRHFGRDEFGVEFRGGEAPVAVGEVAEEEPVEWGSVELDECFLGVLRLFREDFVPELGGEEAGDAADEGKWGDPADHVAELERVAVEGTGPADFGVEGDLDAFLAHDIVADVLEDFAVEFVEHVHAEVVPVTATQVAGGETAWAIGFFDDSDVVAALGEGSGGVETGGAGSEHDDVRALAVGCG